MLGDGVEQRGSDVDDKRLRFDFSHPKAMSAPQLEQVETIVRESVTAKMPVHSAVVPLDEAKGVWRCARSLARPTLTRCAS